MSICHLNGEFLPLAEARISPLDRGFLFGDGVYEVIPAYARKPFLLGPHLDRLRRSLAGVRIADPHDPDAWERLVREQVDRNEPDDQAVYIQVTRGTHHGRSHAFPAHATTTVFMMSERLLLPDAELRERGTTAVSVADDRWLHCDLKTTALLPNVLLRQAAVDQGAAEAVLFRDGWLTEGAASSVLVVRQGELLAPPASPLLLPGITLETVFALAGALGIPARRRPLDLAEVGSADEIWQASTGREVLAITTLDGRPVGDGKPGPAWRHMWSAFQALKAAECGVTIRPHG